MTVTYSPEDNKLRLYAESRLDPDTYARVKAAGFRWAPRQELFVAPSWNPHRENLLLELCGEIGDEDTSLADRTEERAERFTEYSGKRAEDADRAHAAVERITDGIPMGQPILVGHHSEKHARRDAEKIDRGMRRAVKMWETSNYWTSRAAGAIASQKYKEAAPVRQRRIKKLESENRVYRSKFTPDPKTRPIFQEKWDERDGQKVEHVWCAPNNGGGRGGSWVPVESLPRLEAYYTRWIRHNENRLLYERAMLDEQGGAAADRYDFKVGGQVLIGRDWYVVLRVNKSGGAVNSLTHSSPPHVTWTSKWKSGVESVLDYRPQANGDTAKVQAAIKKPPLCNYPGEGFAHMTKAEWARKRKDYKTTREVKNSAHGKHRARWAMAAGRYDYVYLTDQKRVDPPAAALPLLEPAEPPLPATVEPPKPRTVITPKDYDEPDKFDQMKESLRVGVKVVSAPQLFPTPVELARRMVEWADVRPGQRVPEPSAGTGNLLRAVWNATSGCDVVRVVAIEQNYQLAQALEEDKRKRLYSTDQNYEIRCSDFLSKGPLDWGHFQRVVMNPPFANGQDMAHVRHAFTFLGSGGVLVAVMSAGPFFRGDLQSMKFRSWLDAQQSTVLDLPPDTFRSSGTGVNCKLVRIVG